LDGVTEAEVRALFDGMLALAQRDGVSLVGGDLSRTHGGIALDVSAPGFLEGRRALLRDGARPGDVLAVYLYEPELDQRAIRTVRTESR